MMRTMAIASLIFATACLLAGLAHAAPFKNQIKFRGIAATTATRISRRAIKGGTLV